MEMEHIPLVGDSLSPRCVDSIHLPPKLEETFGPDQARWEMLSQQILATKNALLGEHMRLQLLFLVILLLSTAPSMMQAQTNYVALRGEVTDPQHLPIAHANVKVTLTKTGAQREVTADAHGIYELRGLLPGAYVVEAESKGFALARRSLQLEVGQEAT